MSNQGTNEAIADLNRRFVDLCIRATNVELPELSVKLNCTMPFLRELREMSFDARESVVNSGRFLLQPATTEVSLRMAPSLKNAPMISLFLGASIKNMPTSH
jgi:hypothetical protein